MVRIHFNMATILIVILLLFSGVVNADLKKGISSKVTAGVFIPAGGIEATTVQGAIEELDAEKVSGLPVLYARTIYANATGTEVVIGSISDISAGFSSGVQLSIPTSMYASQSGCFSNNGANTGAIKYTCADSRTVMMTGAISASAATDNDVLAFTLDVNGAAIGCLIIQQFVGVNSVFFSCMTIISQNSVIKIKVGNLTAARNMTVKSYTLQVQTL